MCKGPQQPLKPAVSTTFHNLKLLGKINYTDDFAIFQSLNGVGKNSNLPEGKTTLQQKSVYHHGSPTLLIKDSDIF